MNRIVSLIVCLFITHLTFAQKKALNDFSFVVVPMDYEFTSKSDQYKLNSMTKFYLDKAGFNTYFSNETPDADECDGLYADVEKISAFMANKLQLVLKDCNGVEIYRSLEGISKLKEHEVSYQDALRKTMSGLSAMRIQPKTPKIKATDAESNQITKFNVSSEKAGEKTNSNNKKGLPTDNFSSYTLDGNIYLLQKSDEGFTLYKGSDELSLMGKFIVIGDFVKYMDTDGNVSNVTFDQDRSMIIQNDQRTITYKIAN